MEQWQQIKPLAIFKRLLIVSYACLFVWQIEHSNHENIKQIKEFGSRQLKRFISKDF